MFDGSKVKPFGDVALEGLAMDENMRKIIQHIPEPGGRGWSKTKVENAYIHSKARIDTALFDSRFKSYGTREEHRMSLVFWNKLIPQLQQLDIFDCPINWNEKVVHVWILQTIDVCRFLKFNAFKYCFAFETGLSLYHRKSIPYPATQGLIMFLTLLRYALSPSILQADYRVWMDVGSPTNAVAVRRLAVGESFEGMGLSKSIQQFGYGFILVNKFDFKNWRFPLNLQKRILFQYTEVHKAVGPNLQAGADNIELNQAIDFLLNSLSNIRDREIGKRVECFIFGWIWTRLVDSFCMELIQSLNDPKLEDCWNRQKHKIISEDLFINDELSNEYELLPIRSKVPPLQAIRCLWNYNDSYSRKWNNKKYRLVYQQICQVLKEVLKEEKFKIFEEGFFKYFVSVTWMWPNVTTEKWWTYSGGERQWYCLQYKPADPKWYLKPESLRSIWQWKDQRQLFNNYLQDPLYRLRRISCGG